MSKITYAVGDIHGCLQELEQLIFRCGDHFHYYFDCTKDTAKFVFVGDYIDRGPDSKGVVDYLIEMSKKEECVFLRGNHEDMLLNDLGLCLSNGGRETFRSYGWPDTHKYIYENPVRPSLSFIPVEHMEFYRNTKLFHKDGIRTYVHAGILRQNVPIEKQSNNILLWVREEFLRDDSPDGGYVVHGHTPIGVEEKDNRINLDSACVFGGVLTAAVFDDSQEKPFQIIQSDRHSKEGPY